MEEWEWRERRRRHVARGMQEDSKVYDAEKAKMWERRDRWELCYKKVGKRGKGRKIDKINKEGGEGRKTERVHKAVRVPRQHKGTYIDASDSKCKTRAPIPRPQKTSWKGE